MCRPGQEQAGNSGPAWARLGRRKRQDRSLENDKESLSLRSSAQQSHCNCCRQEVWPNGEHTKTRNGMGIGVGNSTASWVFTLKKGGKAGDTEVEGV